MASTITNSATIRSIHFKMCLNIPGVLPATPSRGQSFIRFEIEGFFPGERRLRRRALWFYQRLESDPAPLIRRAWNSRCFDNGVRIISQKTPAPRLLVTVVTEVRERPPERFSM